MVHRQIWAQMALSPFCNDLISQPIIRTCDGGFFFSFLSGWWTMLICIKACHISYIYMDNKVRLDDLFLFGFQMLRVIYLTLCRKTKSDNIISTVPFEFLEHKYIWKMVPTLLVSMQACLLKSFIRACVSFVSLFGKWLSAYIHERTYKP